MTTTTATKRYFSQMKTQADLEETFGCTYGLQIESSPPRLGVFALRRELLGEDSGDQEWEKASKMYRAFFEATNGYGSNIRPEEIRGSLGRVLDTLYAAVRVNHKTKLLVLGVSGDLGRLSRPSTPDLVVVTGSLFTSPFTGERSNFCTSGFRVLLLREGLAYCGVTSAPTGV